MLEITIQRGDAIYTRRFPEDKKNEKKVLKFLEEIRDSQLVGPHRKIYLENLKRKKKSYRYVHEGRKENGYENGIAKEIRPQEKLKVSITHVPDTANV